MANTKMTKIEVLKAMAENKEIMGNEIFSEYVAHEIELLEKRKTSPKKEKPEDIALKEAVIEVLNGVESMTAGEIILADERFTGLSNQKMVALLKKLMADGKVTKEMDKKRALFSLI